MKQGVDNPSYGMHGPPPGGGNYLDVKPNSAGSGAASRGAYLDVRPGAGGKGFADGLDNPTYGMSGAPGSYMDVKPNPPRGGGSGAYMDVKPDPIGATLAAQLAAGEAIYDQVHGGAIGQRLADALNKNDMYVSTRSRACLSLHCASSWETQRGEWRWREGRGGVCVCV
jgi:hypothetical protein